MTGRTGPAPTPKPEGTRFLDDVVRRAQAALLWEGIWPPLAATGVVLLVFLTLSWLGLFVELPPLLRVVAVFLFGAGLFATLFPLVKLALPERREALARIDRESAARHRPATALTDPLANTSDDSVTRALWAAHRNRVQRDAEDLRAGYAAPHLAERDPRALRFLAILLAFVAFVSAGEDRGTRTLSAFDWRSPAGGVPPRLDAWIAPPPYTGRPPVFLTQTRPEDGAAALEDNEADTVHTVPFGSVLVVRTSGGEADIMAPGARLLKADEKAPTAPGAPRSTPGEGVSERRFVLERDTTVTVDPAGGEDRIWRFTVLADAPPQIAFRAPPRTNQNGALVLDYNMEDDYGVANARALVTRRDVSKTIDHAPRPLYGPPEIKLALPQGRARSGDALTNLDLVEHPWAGTPVAMTLLARDEPGQEGRSEALDTVLPARRFTQPLARALIEQRRHLALDAERRADVLNALDALSLYPDRFTTDAGAYLGLRTAHSRLFYASSDDDMRGVVDYLWEIAITLEDGDLPGLQSELKQAEQNLRDALERNASDEEIKKLMDELRAALGKFMEEMARRMQQQPGMQAQLPPGAKLLTPDDLKRMLDRMEDLARGGNKQAAQNLLSELREMLNNLQTAQPGGEMDEGSEAAAKALDELGKMIREQSELRDKTFRQRQPGQQEPGNKADGSNPSQLGDLGKEQGGLKSRLEELLKELEGKGLEGDPSLGDAGEEMGAAEGHLGKGDANRAFNAQGRALEALRKGAQGMADKMMQGQQGQGQGQAGQPGSRGQPSAQEDTDPLGRPTRARRYDPGSNVRIPGEIEAQRARRVLEELRRRIGDPSRPQLELDYLERLLRD
ncbi:TIGR02302 family protein [Terrihabitans soli]|uniref:TIGR02302 family protein n=1 Tax=Terrihabitans soli TaxID=708113 RepID=A0A6S6QSX7_9HYPH|nr:TIGR02302 family protein [Terrihabitans soli]BCJ89558.1 TIGR02302 family protein [Terrihabitans soli]